MYALRISEAIGAVASRMRVIFMSLSSCADLHLPLEGGGLCVRGLERPTLRPPHMQQPR